MIFIHLYTYLCNIPNQEMRDDHSLVERNAE
jgi:hypothetical protein